MMISISEQMPALFRLLVLDFFLPDSSLNNANLKSGKKIHRIYITTPFA
jgi:hypothetical protein